MTHDPEIHGRSGAEWSEAERPAGGGGGIIAALALVAGAALAILVAAYILFLLT